MASRAAEYLELKMAVALLLAAVAEIAAAQLPREQLEVPYIKRPIEDALTLSVIRGDRPGGAYLVFFHGGGWSRGDKADLLPFARRLAGEGITVLLPNYRLAPDSLFPAQTDDAAAAVAYAIAHAKDFAADKKCLFIGGESAGAHIAALALMHPRFFEKLKIKPKQIAGFIGVNGVYRIAAQEGGATQEFLASVFGFDELTWRYASPIELVPAADKQRLPPMAIVWGKDEPPFIANDSENFAKALQVHGQSVAAYALDAGGREASLAAVSAGMIDALSQGQCGAVARK